MKRPGTLEVADKLRLHIYSELNNVEVKKWESKHYEEWDCILNGVTYVPKPNKYAPNGNSNRIQVSRVADGKSLKDSIGKEINYYLRARITKH